MLAGLQTASLAQSAAAEASYVAMGSSFAAGPGLKPYAADAPKRCGRSTSNFANQLAARRGLSLTDVSCSAATSEAVLQAWGDIPAQIDAVTPATRLVTITIGGNDVGYIGNLMALSCNTLLVQGRVTTAQCPVSKAVTEADFSAMDRSMRAISAAIQARAPKARLVFVDYLTVLPPSGSCAATPLTAAQADQARAVSARVQAITAEVARDVGALLVAASRLSLAHDACSAEPWVWGYPAAAGGMPYHPNALGMAALATALDQALPR